MKDRYEMAQDICAFIYSSEHPVEDIEYLVKVFRQVSEHALTQFKVKTNSQLKILELMVDDLKQ